MKQKKLWQKSVRSDATMQALCTANDPEIDTQLVWFDCLGSYAQALMLKKIGVYDASELKRVLGELKRIAKLSAAGKICVPAELEDSHTTIEAELTKKLGASGKKIHTGRSRNDQSALMMRLFLRRSLVEISNSVLPVLKSIEHFYQKQGELLIPGYTHMQPAMPASVGMWLHSVYEGLLRFVKQSLQYDQLLNECPLGSGAGFGSSFELDRKLIAQTLGFERVQRSFIDVNNSRGRFDEGLLQVLSGLAFVAEKVACDLMLFLTKEFSLVKLSDRLKTGSSIMPQKNNPDLVELLRARAAVLRSVQLEESFLISKLPSSYHRDLQFSKEPALRGVRVAKEIVLTLQLLFDNISFDPDQAKKLLYPELFATYQANRLVEDGLPFRDAYQVVAGLLAKNQLQPADYAKELKQPLKQTKLGFLEAVGESRQVSKLLAKSALRERACERLIGSAPRV